METSIVKQGDTLRRDIVHRYLLTGEVVDLTGCTAYSQLKTKPGEELKCEGTTAIDTDTGIVTVIFSAAQTAELEPGDYGFDVRLELDDYRITIYTERITVILPYTDIEEE